MHRIGLVGSGFIAGQHAAGYAALDNAKIAAVASVDDNVSEFVSDHGLAAETYGSAEEMFGDSTIDIVDVCTPTSTHKEIAERAAHNGFDVLCEKPIARTIDEAKKMVETIRDTGVAFMVGHLLRFFPEYVEAKRMVENGAIGTPGTVHCERLSSGPPKTAWNDWYADKRKSGGVLLDMAIHDFDFLRWMLGDVERVFARTTEWRENDRLKQYAATELRFEDGTIGHVDTSWALPPETPFTTKFEFSGDEGMIEFDSRDENSFHVTGVDDAGNIPQSPLTTSPIQYELEHFLSCIEDGTEPAITPADAIEAARISLAAIESAQRGAPVDPREVDA